MPTEPWNLGKLTEEEVHELADRLKEKYTRMPGSFFTCDHDTMVAIIADAGLTVLGDFPMDIWRQQPTGAAASIGYAEPA